MPQILITPPPIEPVTVADMMLQLGMGTPADGTLDAQLTAKLTGLTKAARGHCESYTRRVLITQSWRLLLDGWPHVHRLYLNHGHHPVLLPKQPFQSLTDFTYVDTQGITQPMSVWGFQTDPGSDAQPARLNPPYLMPWPPVRMIPNNISITFKCGYGGPVTASMTANSPILTGPVFNPGDVGQAVSVPGAIAAVSPAPATALVSSILSIDISGQATLAASATAAVTGVQAYIGQQVPDEILTAIMFMAQHFFQNGADVDLPTPRIVAEILSPYCNRVS